MTGSAVPWFAGLFVASTLPFGAVGGVIGHIMTALIIAALSLPFRKRPEYACLAVVANAFAVAHLLAVIGLSGAMGVARVGYLLLAVAATYYFWRPAASIEAEAKVEALIALASGTFVLGATTEVFTNGPFGPVVSVVSLAFGALFLMLVLGLDTVRQIRFFAVAATAAMSLLVFDHLIPADHLARLWAIPNLVFIAELAGRGRYELAKVTSDRLGRSAVPARRGFGLLQQLVLFTILSLFLVTTGIVAVRRDGDDLAALMALGVLVTGLVVYRLRLLVELRDWAHDQETILRAYGDRILGLEDDSALTDATLDTLADLTDNRGRVAIITLDESNKSAGHEAVTVKAQRTRLTGASPYRSAPVHHGFRDRRLRDWFRQHSSGGSSLCVDVPTDRLIDSGDAGRLLFVAQSPGRIRADVVDQFKVAASQYSLALRANGLAAELRDSVGLERFMALSQDTTDLVIVSHPETLATQFTGPSVFRLLRLEPGDYTGTDSMAAVFPDDRERAQKLVDEARASDGPVSDDIRVYAGDGSVRWHAMTIRDLSDDPLVGGLLVTSSDIHDRKMSDMVVRQSERRQRALLQNSTDVSMLVSSGLITYVSSNVKSCFGYEESVLTGQAVTSLLIGSSRHEFDRAYHQVVETGESANLELKLRPAERAGADPLIVEVAISDSDLGDGASRGREIVVLLRDITDRRHLENSLRDRVTVDTSTGLLNRSAFIRAIDDQVRQLESTSVLAVGCIDMDGLRIVTQRAGFGVADRVVSELAGRLTELARSSDALARVSADQFAFATIAASEAHAVSMAHRLKAALSEPVAAGGDSYEVDVTVGLATTTSSIMNTAGPGVNGASLLQQAAVTASQTNGLGPSVLVFEQSMQDAADERYELSQDLRSAGPAGELHLVYQPLLSFEDQRIDSVEALVRWNHPRRGPISPGSFIPLAEENGTIVDLGRWVLDTACQSLARWRSTHDSFDGIKMDVNVSPAQLANDREAEALVGAVLDSGIDPNLITFELTETIAASDAGRLRNRLHNIRQHGISVAIDDFGTGVAGLGYLRDFPVDVLKIDRSYVEPLAHSEELRSLVKGIIEMGQHLDAVTVAEGVESYEQVDILASLGCDLVQGFLFARPMAEEQLISWVAARTSGQLVHGNPRR